MEIMRTVMDSDRLTSIMDIPEDFRHREVEVVVSVRLSGESEAKPKESSPPRRSIKGRFKEYADLELRKLEKEAWAMAVEEKFGKKS